MIVDPDPPARRLPYELEIRILGATSRGSSSAAPLEAYVDTYFNDTLYSTTFVGPKSSTDARSGSGGNNSTTCGTTVIKPMHYLDPSLKISFVVHKHRVTSANVATAGRVDLQLSHLLHDKNKGFIEHEYPVQNSNSRYLQLAIELREQVLFEVLKVNRHGAEGGQVVLSPRLKDKIIILSLAIESNCNGLLDEIVGFLAEAENYITELDLYDIIDDINQMYKNSEYSKLITLLQDHPLKNVIPFPLTHAEWCVYTKVMSLPAPADPSESSNESGHAAAAMTAQGRRGGLHGGSTVLSGAFTQRHAEVEENNEGFLRYQPCMSRDRTPGFLRQQGDAPELANITPGMGGYRLTICCIGGSFYELIWGNFYEYIQVQKVFSMLKYQPEELESGHIDGSWQVLYYPNIHGDVAKDSVKAVLHLDPENLSFHIAPQREKGESDSGRHSTVNRSVAMWEPVSIGFDEVSVRWLVGIECSRWLHGVCN
jgi:hypothetical protein